MTKALSAQIADLKKDFTKYSLECTTGIEKAVLTGCLKVETTAKKKFRGRDDESIKGLPPRVDTGRLRASITHRVGKNFSGEILGEVGTNVEYAKDVEYGTSDTWPHPYLNPSLTENADFIEKQIAKAVKDAEP